VVDVPAWARAVLKAETGERRPERAFQRILEHTQEVILDQCLNTFVIFVRLRVACARCVRLGGLERCLETAQLAEKGEMRRERAFQRILEHMQELILVQRLNTFVICVRLRVVCARCVRLGARGARKTAQMG
jgi:hypothetical protein